MWEKIFDYIQEKVTDKTIKITICLIALFFIWIFCPELSYNPLIISIPLDLLFKIFLTIIILTIILYISFHIKKNKTSKCGLGIYISSSVIEKKDVRKELLFTNLKQELKKDYELIIYDIEDLKRLNKKHDLEYIMKKLNLTILFEVSERTGKKDHTNVYELKILRSLISTEYYNGTEKPSYIRNDLTQATNNCLQITQENSINDVESETTTFEIGVNYIISMLLSLSKNPEKAFNILDNINGVLTVAKMNKQSIKFVKDNIKYVYMIAYLNCAQKIMDTKKYYCDEDKMRQLKYYLSQFKSLIDKNRKEIPAKLYNNLLTGYYIPMSVVCYEEGKIKDGLDCIYKCDLTLTPSKGILFNKAFLLAHDKKYYKSYQTYKKLSSKKHSDEQINSIISFIEDRNEYDENDCDVKFCLAMMNYYYKDKFLAEKYLQELSMSNNEIKNIYDEIKENNK